MINRLLIILPLLFSISSTAQNKKSLLRTGNDLYTDKTIDCYQAIRGCEIQLKTLTDSIIKVQVPAGTQPGTLINCKNQGMPIHKTLNIRGNLYVKIMVLIPQLSPNDLKKIKNL